MSILLQMPVSQGARSGHTGISFSDLPLEWRRGDSMDQVLSDKVEFFDVHDAVQVMLAPDELAALAPNNAPRSGGTSESVGTSGEDEVSLGTDFALPQEAAVNASVTGLTVRPSGDAVRLASYGSDFAASSDMEQVFRQTAASVEEVALTRAINGSPESSDISGLTLKNGPGLTDDLTYSGKSEPVFVPHPTVQREPSINSEAVHTVSQPVLRLATGPAVQGLDGFAKSLVPQNSPIPSGTRDVVVDASAVVVIKQGREYSPSVADGVVTERGQVFLSGPMDAWGVQNISAMDTGAGSPDNTPRIDTANSPVWQNADPFVAAHWPKIQVIGPSPAIATRDIDLSVQQPLVRFEEARSQTDDGVQLPLSVLRHATLTDRASPPQVTTSGVPGFDERMASASPALVPEADLSIAASPPAVSARSEPLAPFSVVPRQIVQQIFDATLRAIERPVDLILNPEELGKVRISMVMVENGITMNILTERPETLELIRRHIDQLAQEFRQIGYSTIGFSFGQHKQGSDGMRPWPATPEGGILHLTDVVPRQAPSQIQQDTGLDMRI